MGGNLKGGFGSVQALLEAALDEFAGAGLTLLVRSKWWRSAAWPNLEDPDYLNAVAIVETRLGPAAALEALHGIERRFGRERERQNAPRTLDLDLIAYGRLVSQDAPILPHPRAAERLFVMGPLAEVAPDWVHPVLGKTASALALTASVGRDARPLRV
ncbi:2-amino-4-hydroxy-6-hydroxymethyldihydropteridine diphosphokinase [Phenylobacterium montanum]|uniref:2-amino-4-hydroxy-6- hydroxymethyldihydropteridine diphosphokinase n=1 Tax=Phenylobacterium montanum TaxID=2823693 RepID=UPI00345F8B63